MGWAEKAQKVIDAMAKEGEEFPNGANEDTHCLYCSAWLDYGGEHATDCIVLLARSMTVDGGE